MEKVFLGGCTTPKLNWRSLLIPKLNINYFNPLINGDKWTLEHIDIEEDEKRNCDYHLYVITPYSMGIYSLIEAGISTKTDGKITLVCFINSDENQFNNAQLASINASKNLLRRNGAIILNTIEGIANYLNQNSNV